MSLLPTSDCHCCRHGDLLLWLWPAFSAWQTLIGLRQAVHNTWRAPRPGNTLSACCPSNPSHMAQASWRLLAQRQEMLQGQQRQQRLCRPGRQGTQAARQQREQRRRRLRRRRRGRDEQGAPDVPDTSATREAADEQQGQQPEGKGNCEPAAAAGMPLPPPPADPDPAFPGPASVCIFLCRQLQAAKRIEKPS